MFLELFIKKASRDRICQILEVEGFVYTDTDVQGLLGGNEKGMRYGNAVLLRDEGSQRQKRFFKVVLDGKWRTYKLFQRQVQITDALHADSQFTGPTMAVIQSSFKPSLPYMYPKTVAALTAVLS